MITKCLTIKDYKLFKNIGKGSFGEVYLAVKQNNNEPLAVKRIELRTNKHQDMMKYLNYEISIMKELKHPNIIQLIEYFQSHNHLYVIMEYCNGGSLSSCLKKYGKPFPVEILQYFMRQIVDGLQYIHSKKIIHRDLKLDNILVTYKTKEDKLNDNLLKSQIKIIDFGLAIQLGTKGFAETVIGTPLFMDPKMLEGIDLFRGKKKIPYDEKVDIWSLGAIFYQMLTGQQLYDANNLDELKHKVQSGDYSIPTNVGLYTEVISFLNSMLQYDGKKRKSAKELYEHPFLTKNINEFTKLDLRLISHKIKGNAINMNSLRANSTVLFQEEKSNNIKPEESSNKGDNNYQQLYIQNKKTDDLLRYVNGLLYEYKEAKNYFKNNNLQKQEQDAYNKYLEIKKVKSNLESGKIINTMTLPLPVNPEYIYGYSSQERDHRFQEVLNKYMKEKNKLETQIKIYEKSNIANNNDLEKYKIKLQKLSNLTKDLDNKYNNKWFPAPEYEKEAKKCKIEKISYVNCDFKMKIQLKKLDNKREKLGFIIFLKINDIQTINKEININYEENFYTDWIWTLKYNEWKNIDNNNEHFILGIDNNIYYDISKTVNNQAFSFNFFIPTPNNNQISFTVAITPILPIGQKFESYELKDCFNVKRFFPAFNGKSPYTENMSINH